VRCTPICKVHACEVHACEVHACEVHAYEMHALLVALYLSLEDLELEDTEALGLRIEKCVNEVLRSHLVERPLNTTKNYVPK
jgi:hypothetical protein